MYTIAWYELPLLLKTEIYLLILRSQKPSKITAGKFYVMHLENFNAVRYHYFLHYKIYQNYEIFTIYVYIHTIKKYSYLNLFIGVEHGCLVLHVASQFWFG